MQTLRELQDKAPEKFNVKAEWYLKRTTLRMPEAEQNKRLDLEINTRVNDIKKDIGAEAWEKLTDGQKAVAVDVHYANKGGLKKFPRFKEALMAGDAEAIARESTFYSDKESGKRPMKRLTRNRAAATGEDLSTAEKKLEEQLKQQKTSPPEKPDIIKDEAGEDEIKGNSGDDVLSPEHKKVAEDLTKQDNPLEEILDKNPADLTEGELRQVMLARKSAKTDIEREKLFGVEKAFYDGVYGTGNAKYDVTGKMIEPTPIRPINENPVAARDKVVAENLKSLAKAVAAPRSSESAPEVVKALQSGLNILNRARTEKLAKKQFGSASPLFSELKDDGVPGPKTRGAFKTTAAKLGPAKVKEGMALGRFKRFADAPKLGDLRTQTEGAFGDLFRRPSVSKPKATDEGLGLQATINDLGGDTFANSFKPIKEDGDIGPKTETAFNQLLPATGADSFTSKLGDNFGFFDDDDEGGFFS